MWLVQKANIGFFNIDGLVWVNIQMGVGGDSRLANQALWQHQWPKMIGVFLVILINFIFMIGGVTVILIASSPLNCSSKLKRVSLIGQGIDGKLTFSDHPMLIDQVWSLSQINHVNFLQSKIIAKKCVLNKHGLGQLFLTVCLLDLCRPGKSMISLKEQRKPIRIVGRPEPDGRGPVCSSRWHCAGNCPLHSRSRSRRRFHHQLKTRGSLNST